MNKYLILLLIPILFSCERKNVQMELGCSGEVVKKINVTLDIALINDPDKGTTYLFDVNNDDFFEELDKGDWLLPTGYNGLTTDYGTFYYSDYVTKPTEIIKKLRESRYYIKIDGSCNDKLYHVTLEQFNYLDEGDRVVKPMDEKEITKRDSIRRVNRAIQDSIDKMKKIDEEELKVKVNWAKKLEREKQKEILLKQKIKNKELEEQLGEEVGYE